MANLGFNDVVSYWTGQGYPEPVARGIARGLAVETKGFDPLTFNPSGGGQGALGLGQWRGPRQQALLSTPNWQDPYTQLDFANRELHSTHTPARDALSSARTEQEAYRAWRDYFEIGEDARGGSRKTSTYDPELGRETPYVQVSPAREPDPIDAILMAAAMQQPTTQPQPNDDATLLLESLLEPPGRPQGAGTEVPSRTARPEAKAERSIFPEARPLEAEPAKPLPGLPQTQLDTEIPPSQPQPQAAPFATPEGHLPPAPFTGQHPDIGIIDEFLAAAKDLGTAPAQQAAPSTVAPAQPSAQQAAPPAATPTQPTTPSAVTPATPTELDRILDSLLGLPLAAGQFWKGTSEGLLLPKEKWRAAEPEMTPTEHVGSYVGRIPGGMMVEPVRHGAELMDKIISGQPVTQEEMQSTALESTGLAMTGSIGRGGLGSGPRLPRREPPPLGREPEVPVPMRIPEPPSLRTGGAAPEPAPTAPAAQAASEPEQIIQQLAEGGGGREPPRAGGPPEPPVGPPSAPAPRGRISAAWNKFKGVVAEATRDAQIKVVPMAAGDTAGMAIAKDYANLERLARFRRSRWDTELRAMPLADQQAMWEAMDNASVAAQVHGYDAGKRFIDALPKAQRNLLMEMEQHGIELWQDAMDAGLVTEGAERLPFYVPRSILEVSEGGATRIPGGGQGMSAIDQFGVNLRRSPLRSREHLTAEETEAAARAKLGESAQIVRNIRSLPIAYEKLERAIAGRRLINELREIGEATGNPAVIEGGVEEPGFFTIPGNSLFQTTRPRFTTVEDKTVPVRDQNGNMVYDRVPLYVSRQFEGPLRAIARGETKVLYRSAMALKSASMATIMNSPAIHNLVEWGRALGSMPGKVGTFKIYGIGAKVLANKRLMEQAIRHGLVPIGERGYLQDIEGIATAADLQPGRGLLAKGVGALTDIVSPKAGQAVRRGIDKAGDFWHQKLLWDQVAKLQAGLFNEFAKHLIKKGIDRPTAFRMAAHFANRFAGAVPSEAMSEMARKSLNFILFSRSFTTGNLGVMKDMINGLPRDARAQIGRDLYPAEVAAARSLARRKAIGTVMADIAIAYATNSILQATLPILLGDRTLDDEARGYAERWRDLMQRGKESPTEVMNPLADLLALSPTAENEPGKQDRVMIGHAADGTAVYLRSPVGKIGEEFAGWLTQPLYMLRNKQGTIARPLFNTLANDRGFGQKVYNANPSGIADMASNIGRVMWEFMRSQTPEYQLRAAYKLFSGKGDWVDVAQAGAPFLGGTISRGAPGGEAIGELMAARSQHSDKVREALPQVRELVKDGKMEDAAMILQNLGVPNRLINYYLKTATDPKARLSPKAMRDFGRYATPEQQRRMERQMDRGPLGGRIINQSQIPSGQ